MFLEKNEFMNTLFLKDNVTFKAWVMAAENSDLPSQIKLNKKVININISQYRFLNASLVKIKDLNQLYCMDIFTYRNFS